MTRSEAEQAARAMFQRGEIDEAALKNELAGIAYAHGEMQNAADEQWRVAS